jgi:signal transduction histidine kinase
LSEQEWHPLGAERRVVFAHLSPGVYTFEVKAVTENGIASETPAVVRFSILAPFWQQWWFVGLVVLAIVTMTAGIMWLRTRHLLAIAQVRTGLATDLHDEIGSSLTRISLFSSAGLEELKKAGASNANGKLAALINDISGISRGLVDTMSDIVWSVDPDKDSVEELLIRMKTYAGRIFEARGIEYDVDSHPGVSNLNLPPEVRRNILLIFKEALTNIIRHSEATAVNLAFSAERERFILRIRDNGKGFKFETLGRVNGLKNMQKRADQIGGSLVITSKPSEGTVVDLRRKLP